uniref:Uncharacterized protein n=1 Tax=Candidatus Methanophaga sp. ANME-1 ERB7 TaxID=2759913 RepID=A0A7G9Z3L6_9EURY|nr:hypothetical protein PAHOCELH_00011 [Methanosarcinales archaeon ANME-1 ERB7]
MLVNSMSSRKNVLVAPISSSITKVIQVTFDRSMSVAVKSQISWFHVVGSVDDLKPRYTY